MQVERLIFDERAHRFVDLRVADRVVVVQNQRQIAPERAHGLEHLRERRRAEAGGGRHRGRALAERHARGQGPGAISPAKGFARHADPRSAESAALRRARATA
jgi:hypothetical protein